ncbi:DEAD/DEAH box helicase [Natronomonas marina]|uniref:DEAD/DEAH box helicase n=1 Tax=Natronomonas marina TaxID=2961939 RepID=UPI0020C9F72D|nr:DEAD/DEAH box helicase [Natronomonas marina]
MPRNPNIPTLGIPRPLDRGGSQLADRGINELYAHQTDAIEAVRDGQNVVLATPTASGKSLAYTIPAIERAHDHDGRTLYIGPQVALINDQEATLSDFAAPFGDLSVTQYTGSLSSNERQQARDEDPGIVLTTPDMLHCGLLSHASDIWRAFFHSLELVVVDEVHEYRGVFGSHVGLVCRRLARICDRLGADPQFVCCSATIGNPREHAATITGQPTDSFELVDEDTSETGPTHWLFWQPPEYDEGDAPVGAGQRRSHHGETMRLFVDLVMQGYQTVAFTRARQTAERYATISSDTLAERGQADIAQSVTAYHAGLRDDRRATIETALHSGDCAGVWSTSALELGVDIGSLDAVLLDGYPGTQMATFQRAGRAGRGTDPSLVALVASEDQLDQYIIKHSHELFEQTPERAVANPSNPHLLKLHAHAAAMEGPLRTADEAYFGPTFPDIVSALTDEGELTRQQTDQGLEWRRTASGRTVNPYEQGLRTITERTVTLRVRGGATDELGELPLDAALRDVHPGAIYHHQGQNYEVQSFDLDRDVAWLTPTDSDHQTRVQYEESMTIEEDIATKPLATRDDVTVHFADVTRRKQVTGFQRRDHRTGEIMTEESLDLPETTLSTRALYVTLPMGLESLMQTMSGSFEGGLHAVQHALVATFPLVILCDRRDVGSVSTAEHPQTETSALFIYDSYRGGVGLARNGYDHIEELFQHTWELLADCGCSDGCPACIQSPHCGQANEPLDKRLAATLTMALADPSRQAADSTP